jgi:sirohydrochlorin cobaltochelatase
MRPEPGDLRAEPVEPRPEPVEGPARSVVPLIGLAHGSRHAAGADAIERLMAALDGPDHPARHAFLDLAAPDLGTVAAELAAAGHRRAVIVPLLFTVAFHATVDVPQAVHAAAQSAGIELEVADILGTGDDVAALLLSALADAGVHPEVSVLLYAVGSSNSAANLAVVELAARLERSRSLAGVPGGRPPGGRTGSGRVRAAFATCAPRPAEVLDQLPEPVAVLPLFLADGLLLDPARTLADSHGWTLVEPLGERAAAVVLERYRSAL